MTSSTLIGSALAVGRAIKTVVLDTSGLVADPGGLTDFAGPALWVRPTLVQELDI